MRAGSASVFSAFTVVLCWSAASFAVQGPEGFGGMGSEALRDGMRLDVEGKGAEARAIFQKAIDGAETPEAKANAERAMAMSWAFEGNCKQTAAYEDKVIEYWKTQEKEMPDRAFYQEGEMADEAARVCIDNGDLDAAQALYKKGHDLGASEPDIAPARKDLWDFRWEHAEARIEARRGHKAEAEKHMAAAKLLLEDMRQKDAGLYEQQASFLPYLEGYVALYTGDYQKALGEFEKANQGDVFIQCLIGMAFEKLGDQAKAAEAYRKAASRGGHNPPAAFAHHFTATKLGKI